MLRGISRRATIQQLMRAGGVTDCRAADPPAKFSPTIRPTRPFSASSEPGASEAGLADCGFACSVHLKVEPSDLARAGQALLMVARMLSRLSYPESSFCMHQVRIAYMPIAVAVSEH
jgi:hypothetical protein